MLYFATRQKARIFAKATNKTVRDFGAESVNRWAVAVIKRG